MSDPEAVRIVVPEVPVSLNRLLRMHWKARMEYNRDWINLIRSRIAYPPQRMAVKRSVRIMQHRYRLLDEDNLYGSCKVIIDALRHWDLLHEDSPEWMELEVQQIKDTRQKTEIEIR